MFTKDEILSEIERTAKENGGKPLGFARFRKETGIAPHDWGKYWARFGDAQKEAGFEANQLQGAYSEEFLIKKIIYLARKLNKFPTYKEITVERNNDPELPNQTTFARFGSKEKLAIKVAEYCKTKDGYEDIIEFCRPVLQKPKKEITAALSSNFFEVYLFKSGRYYKIGKTNDSVRRGSELRIQLPEDLKLIHSIKTDDPSGIEAYWHKRFESKRKNGEWFDLNSADIRAFKAWKRII